MGSGRQRPQSGEGPALCPGPEPVLGRPARARGPGTCVRTVPTAVYPGTSQEAVSLPPLPAPAKASAPRWPGPLRLMALPVNATREARLGRVRPPCLSRRGPWGHGPGRHSCLSGGGVHAQTQERTHACTHKGYRLVQPEERASAGRVVGELPGG